MTNVSVEDFKNEVAAAVAGCSDEVFKRVVSLRRDSEVNRLFPILDKGMQEEALAEKALAKIKPDNTYDSEGNVLTTTWSEAKNQARIKAEKTLKQWRDALSSVFSGDFGPLEKLVKGSNGSNGSNQAQSKEDE